MDVQVRGPGADTTSMPVGSNERSPGTQVRIRRTPLVISAGDLVVGPLQSQFIAGDPSSLLHEYLGIIRELRGQEREPRLTLRGDDISALAAHLGVSESDVLGDLLDLMGASRAQRRALFSLFAAGALTIVATGSVALALSASGSAAGIPTVSSEAPLEATPAGPPVPSTVSPVVAAPVSHEVLPTAEDEPTTAMARGGPEWSAAIASALNAIDPVADATESTSPYPSPMRRPVPPVEGAGADDGATAGEGVADDGSVVGVAPPPVPPVEGAGADEGATAGEGVADDGSVVGVAPPPVPPVEDAGDGEGAAAGEQCPNAAVTAASIPQD